MIIEKLIQLSLISKVISNPTFGLYHSGSNNQLPLHDICDDDGSGTYSRRSLINDGLAVYFNLDRRTFWGCNDKSKLWKRTFWPIDCPPTASCPTGYTLNAAKNSCCKKFKPKDITCSTGYVVDKSGKKCIPETPKCEPPLVLNPEINKCVQKAPTCPAGSKLNDSDNKCHIQGVPPKELYCNSGQVFGKDGLCYPETSPSFEPEKSCPVDYKLDKKDGLCHFSNVPPANDCPQETKFYFSDSMCHVTGKPLNGSTCDSGLVLAKDGLCYPPTFVPFSSKKKCPDDYKYDSKDNLCHLTTAQPTDTCPSGTQYNENDKQCYVKGKKPNGNNCGSGLVKYIDQLCYPPLFSPFGKDKKCPVNYKIDSYDNQCHLSDVQPTNPCPDNYKKDSNTGKCIPAEVISPNDRCPQNYSFFDGYGSMCYPYLPKPSDGDCPQGSEPAPKSPAYCFCPDQPYFPSYPIKPLTF